MSKLGDSLKRQLATAVLALGSAVPRRDEFESTTIAGERRLSPNEINSGRLQTLRESLYMVSTIEENLTDSGWNGPDTHRHSAVERLAATEVVLSKMYRRNDLNATQREALTEAIEATQQLRLMISPESTITSAFLRGGDTNNLAKNAFGGESIETGSASMTGSTAVDACSGKSASELISSFKSSLTNVLNAFVHEK